MRIRVSDWRWVGARFTAKTVTEAERAMLKGGLAGELYEVHGKGRSVRRIARELGGSRNTVRRYLRSPG